MDTNAYLTFLLLGAALIAVDGQLIYRSGRRLLRQAGADMGSAEPMARLIVVLFHLIALGVLAIGSTFDTDSWDTVTGVVGRLGILLLFLAVAHGIATAVLANLRDREVSRARRLHRQAEFGESPLPSQEANEPFMTPAIEEQPPYTPTS